jgi:hypothetical protein
MCRSAPQSLVARVDGEDTNLLFSEDGVVCDARIAEPTVLLETNRPTILDLVRGRASVHEVVISNRWVIFGAVTDIRRFHETLQWYLRGGVRCPSFPSLLRDYERNDA